MQVRLAEGGHGKVSLFVGQRGFVVPSLSLADLRRLRYGGGSDAEYQFLLEQYELGKNAATALAGSGPVDAPTVAQFNALVEAVEGNRIRSARARRTSGNLLLASRDAWGDVDNTLDLVLPAAVGDQILVGINCTVVNTASVAFWFDVATLVAGSPVHSFSSAGTPDDSNHSQWFASAGTYAAPHSPMIHEVHEGDLSSGTVTLRLRCKTANTTNPRVVRAVDTEPFSWWAVNLQGSESA